MTAHHPFRWFFQRLELFANGDHEFARISKKWTGLGYELFNDKDTFLVEFNDPALPGDQRALVLAAAIYVDLMFFEKKGNGGVVDIFKR